MNIKTPKTASTRVVFNTGVLYAKMLITMGISLYSVRLVLNALGDSDYGIFNLIAGVIAMLSFLNAAMTVSTQRYLSFHQGTGDVEMQKKIFTNSWVLHIAIGVIVVAALLVLTPFLFNGFLNIPVDRIPTARAVYYFMTVSVFFTIIAVPFTASLNAHENMLWIAVVMIVESLLKLVIAVSLVYFIQTERLFVYGLLMAGIAVVSFVLYAVFCLKKYNECSVRNYAIDRPLLKELTGFAGWNLFGALCGLGRSQGLAIILNLFFGTVVNAAYGITNQIYASTNFLWAAIMKAFNPQIMKKEGMSDRVRVLRLSMMASKCCFFLVSMIVIPIIFEMPVILKLWLKNVPEYTVAFCSLALIGMIILQLTVGLKSAIQASGKIRNYQIITGIISIFNLPIAYILLKMNFDAYSVLISFVGIELLNTVVKLVLAKNILGISIRIYCKKVFMKGITPVLLSVVTCCVITHFCDLSFRFLITISFSIIVFAIAVYFTGLCKDEKTVVDNYVKEIARVLSAKL
jgi:O-antigen/teichoic acid export membrane protein